MIAWTRKHTSQNSPIHTEWCNVQNSKHTLACVSGGGILTATCLHSKENQLGKVIQSNSQEPPMQKTYWHISHLFDPLVRNQTSMHVRCALERSPRHLHPRSTRGSSVFCWQTLQKWKIINPRGKNTWSPGNGLVNCIQYYSSQTSDKKRKLP